MARMNDVDAERASVFFQRGAAPGSSKAKTPQKQEKKTGCLAGVKALLQCNPGEAFGLFLGFPSGGHSGSTESSTASYEERQPLKELRVRCPAYDQLSEARRGEYKITVATNSAAKDSPGWVNQDRCVACSLPAGPDGGMPPLYFGVYDGHGRFGHEAAEIAATRVQAHLALQETSPLKNPSQALEKAFQQVDHDIFTALGPDVEYSGTTGVGILVDTDKRTLYVANVGDSRAVLGRRIPDAKAPQWEAIPLTSDQKPGLEEERSRIELCGGHVSQHISRDGQPVGPERVWETGARDKPGLAVSRSMGDGCGRHIGVIPTPVVTTRKLGQDDNILLIGSDGIWDSLGNDKAITIAGKFVNNPAIGVKALVNSAHAEEGDTFTDDTTVVMVAFR